MTKCEEKNVPLFKNIKEVLYNSVKLYKNNIAFTIKHNESKKVKYENKTYADFLEDVNSFGAALYKLGLKESRIAVIGRNRYEWAVAYLTNLLGGIVSVPLDKELQLGELEDSLIRSKAKAMVFDGKYKDLIEVVKKRGKTFIDKFICMDEVSEKEDFLYMNQLLETGNDEKICKQDFINYDVDSDKMSLLLFTSGTTSKSKAVMLNQKGIAVNIHDMLKVEGFRSTDVNIALLPFHHIFGSTGLLVMLAAGIKTVFTDGLRYIKDNLKEYKISVFVGVPILIDKMYQGIMKTIKEKGKEEIVNNCQKISRFLLKFKVDIRKKLFGEILQELGGNLRLIISGGASLDKEVAKNFSTFGVDIVQGYGLTETSPVIAAEDVKHKRAGSVGIPMENTNLEIINKDEKEIGEIRVKGPNIMLGYYENEEATKDVLKDGWFYTGDLGYLDKDGYLFITGRKKDVIVLKNGKKVFPEEIECLIGKIPGVSEVFIFGRPNRNDLNDPVICAKVVYDKKSVSSKYGDISEEELYEIIWSKIKEINKTLPKYKYIKGLILTDVPLIKTTTNKIKRNEELKLILNKE